MPLLDEHAGVVDALGQPQLVHAGLQATLQEVLDLEGQHVIELHARLVQHADAHQTPDQGVALEQALGVLLVEGEQLTVGPPSATLVPSPAASIHFLPGSTTDLGQLQQHAPHLALVAQTILADGLELRVPFPQASVTCSRRTQRG